MCRFWLFRWLIHDNVIDFLGEVHILSWPVSIVVNKSSATGELYGQSGALVSGRMTQPVKFAEEWSWVRPVKTQDWRLEGIEVVDEW